MAGHVTSKVSASKAKGAQARRPKLDGIHGHLVGGPALGLTRRPTSVPEPLAAGHLLRLQATHGNQFVLRTVARDPGSYNPEAAEREFREGEAHFRAGDYAKAIVVFERVRQIPGLPEDVKGPLIFSIGMCDWWLKRFATAVKYFEDYLAIPGGTRTADAIDHLADSKKKAGIPERDGAGKYDPDAAEREYRVGEAYFRAGEYGKAIVVFERVRQIPGLPEDVKGPLIFSIGMCDWWLKRYATAAKYFEDYLAIPGGTRTADAIDHLADSKKKAGIPEGDDATKYDPDAAEREYRVGEAYFQSGEYAKAIVVFERVRQIPGLPEDVKGPLIFSIGMCDWWLKRYATAAKYFEDYLAIPGGTRTADAIDHLADSKKKAGIPAGDDATKYDPNAAEREYRIGEAYFRAGEYGKAIVVFERVRQIPGAPDDVRNPIVFSIGVCNLRLERYATAVKYFEDYLALPGGERRDDAVYLMAEAKQKAGIH